MSVKISKQFATVLICMVFQPAVVVLQTAHEKQTSWLLTLRGAPGKPVVSNQSDY